MRLMHDGINSLAAGIARAFPGGMVAGYLNGSYAWSQAQWALFPPEQRVTITVTASANEGDVLDVERYDATPQQARGWIAMRKAAGLYRPTIYCNLSTVAAVRSATGSYILGKDYDIWVASYDGKTSAPAMPGSPPASFAAKQYETTVRWDTTMVYDDGWPHRKPPTAAKLPAPAGISVTLNGRIADFGWGAVPGARTYLFQVFHWNGTAIYGDPVANTTEAGNHVARLQLPGGGEYAVRVRAAEPAGDWTGWKVF